MLALECESLSSSSSGFPPEQRTENKKLSGPAGDLRWHSVKGGAQWLLARRHARPTGRTAGLCRCGFCYFCADGEKTGEREAQCVSLSS